MLFKNVKDQVQVGIAACTGIDSIFVSDNVIVNDIYFREQRCKFIFRSPMNSTILSVKQACGCQVKRSYTKTNNFTMVVVLTEYPIGVFFIFLNCLFKFSTKKRQYN